MYNVFEFRDQLIERYGSFSRSFIRIAAPNIQAEVEHQYAQGPYPSETFRVFKNKERKKFGEYRKQRLVLEAWDKLESGVWA